VGKWFYRGVDLDPRGQFRGYGALWFQLLVRDAAVAVGETPPPRVYGVLDQVLGQAVPISLMDEGPLVAAGVPAVGLAGTVPPSSPRCTTTPTTAPATRWTCRPPDRSATPAAWPRPPCGSCRR
jgi:hypothetical protein